MKVSIRFTRPRSIKFISIAAVISLILLITAFCFVILKPVNAVSFTWQGDQSTLEGDLQEGMTLASHESQFKPSCVNKTVRIGASGDLFSDTFHSVCVYKAANFSYGLLSRFVGGYTDSSLVVSIGNDSRMYKVQNATSLMSNGTAQIKGTDDFIRVSGIPPYYTTKSITMMTDFHKRLTPIQNAFGQLSEYVFSANWDPVLTDENDSIVGAGEYFGISDNRKWLVVEIKGQGLIRINLDDGSVKWFARQWWNTGYGMDPIVELSITDDGKYVAWGGWNVSAGLVEIDDTCGLSSAEGFKSSWYGDPYRNLTDPCPQLSLISRLAVLEGGVSGNFYPSNPRFGAGGAEISYSWDSAVLTLRAHGYSAPEQLGYLAVGDSFASGEGDIDTINNTNIDWYVDATNVNGNYTQGTPREKCHVSLRSYPYLLNKIMKPEGGFKSVACSGALVNDVGGDNANYLGQARGGDSDGGLPRLEGVSNYTALKYEALQQGIQGRNTQIEFVKKYKPKTITVMAGGNDIGFAHKIENCVISQEICEWATESGRAILKSEIDANYRKLEDLYKSLYVESGGAKIYVVGYPQFISPNENADCSSIYKLYLEERQMVYYAVQYMNEIIHKAANRAGVKYVDIEDSLTGNRICDTKKPYVNPITQNPGGFFVSNLWTHEKQEAFHPNAEGHRLIANTIYDQLNRQSLADYVICPGTDGNYCPSEHTIDIPSYFSNLDEVNAHYQSMTSSSIAKTVPHQIILSSYALQPNSQITVELHSEPIELISGTANNEGGVSESITIPSTVEAGYHTIVLKGKTYSGEDVTVSQGIEVIGANPDDRDDDGISDDIDKCLYIPQLNIDADLDGIDDGCDSHVSPEPLLYRARKGDIALTYNGSPEQPNYIYIERNIRAANVTEVVDTYDPDGDGWAIVGVSQGALYTATTTPDVGPIAHFEIVGIGSDIKPYVYTRAGGYGCTSFTPASLAAVSNGQSRAIQKVAMNTDRCRFAASTEDLDFNGIADDEQPLYVARKGNPDIRHTLPNGGIFSEDPDKLYIFRSFHAAETQLGISDYSPTGTAAGNSDELIQSWNLLASTQATQTIPEYNKLTTIEDSNGNLLPVILTKKLNNQCIGYVPANTNVIKKTTQFTRDILKLNQLPQGVSCE